MLNRKEYLASVGKSGTPEYGVAELADKTNGIYNLEEHGGMHQDSPRVTYQGWLILLKNIFVLLVLESDGGSRSADGH